jgi:hypothetical protein
MTSRPVCFCSRDDRRRVVEPTTSTSHEARMSLVVVEVKTSMLARDPRTGADDVESREGSVPILGA